MGESQPQAQLPPLPVTDNEPGALQVLLQANRLLRQQEWPSPYNFTRHTILRGDARDLSIVPTASVHLVVTSPPYFNLKAYASDAGGRQLARVTDYDAFLDQLDKAWEECARVLVPGGRVCCVVGDVLIPRKASGQRHRVLPLAADIQARSRRVSLDVLTPILWFKIGNRAVEARRKSDGRN